MTTERPVPCGLDEWTYRGFEIEQRYYPVPGAKPFPDAFEWQHPEYDGPEDNRCGFSADLEGCVEAIDSILECEDDGPCEQDPVDAYLEARKEMRLLREQGEDI